MMRLGRLAIGIDNANEWFGRAVSWLTLLLVLITVLVALLRYLFAIGWVWMQDAYLWVNGAMFMLGAGYTLLHEKHVRVDFFYTNMQSRWRAGVDLFGVFVFLLPTLGVIFWLSYPYVRGSWQRLEGSLDAGGLPALFLLKTVLLVFCIPLAAQAVSLAIKSLLIILDHPAARLFVSDSQNGQAHD